MRFLKRKIQEAKRIALKKYKLRHRNSLIRLEETTPSSNITEDPIDRIQSKAITKIPENTENSKIMEGFSVKATKNIVKNYARAICNFISSDIADEYINRLCQKFNIEDQQEFKMFVGRNKESVDCIDRFKQMLVPGKNDPQKLIDFKKIFQMLGTIFVKYFSVNWIFTGRMKHKISHLAFRFKMLRRLQKPEFFTHLKSFQKKI